MADATIIQNIDGSQEVAALMFKHEDEVDEPIGPVFAQLKGSEDWIPVAERKDTELKWPEWFPLSQARGMAKHYGIELLEM